MHAKFQSRRACRRHARRPVWTRFAVAVWLASSATGALLAQSEITRGPYLQALLAESVRIKWQTAAPLAGSVRIHPADDPDAVRTIDEDAATVDHDVTVGELSPDTIYAYGVDGGGTFLFRTAPPSGAGAIRVAVIGDSGNVGPGTNQEGVRDIVVALAPDLLVHVGDLVYTETVDTRVFSVYREILARAGFYPARGDHNEIPLEAWWPMFPPPDADPPERIDCAADLLDCPAPPPPEFLGGGLPRRTGAFYGFDWGPAHFTVLDIRRDLSLCTAQQVQFACADLAAARQRGMPWLVLVIHEPPISRGLHCGESKEWRVLVPRLAAAFGIDLVLSGDDHNFQRTFPVRDDEAQKRDDDPYFVAPGGTVYVVSGGGGTTLYGECPPGAVNCDARCRADFDLIPTFARCHHAVELEITPLRLTVRAHAAEGEDCEAGLIDEFTVQRRLEFLRGDLDGDGAVAINDPIAILNHLFLGQRRECAEVLGDAQDDGSLDIADPTYLLGYLFLGRAAPPPPFPECGPADSAGPECDISGCAR